MPTTQHSAECLSDDLLKRYLAGYLPEDSATQVELHLSQCTLCEELMREIDSDVSCDELLRPLQSQSNPPAMGSIQDSEASSNAKQDVAPWLSWMVSREIGPYELIEPLGHGGMGLVYLARHRKLDRLVAIKLLPAHHQTAEARVRFEREILAAGRLQHPAIVSATDAGQFGDMDYLVMEYIRGIDLGRLSKCVPTLSCEEACEIGRQIAIGLSYAHAQGFVHRDIKPSNVILDDAGNVKLLDFGLVLFDRWDGVSNELTTVGQFLGTLDYMAPEQAERCGSVDFRADLYALGATMFKLLCGRAPLAAAPNQSPIDKLRLLATHRPPSLRTLKPDAPEALVRLVDCLLLTNPQSRPASAAHVAEELLPLARPGCLVDLISRARRIELAQQPSNSATVDMTKQKTGIPVLPLRTVQAMGDKGQGNRWWPWIAAALVPLAFLAGYIIQLDTPDGQFIIESEVPGAQVKIVKAGAETKSFKIETGNSVTKLSAGKYEVTLDSPSDGVSIDRDTFVIERGAVVIARIRKATADQSDSKALPPPTIAAEANEEPIFDGKTLTEWLDVARREKDTKSWLVAMNALNALLSADQKDTLFEEVFQLCLAHRDLSVAFAWRLSDRFVDRLLKEIETAEPKKRLELCALPGKIFKAGELDTIWKWLESLAESDAGLAEALVRVMMGEKETGPLTGSRSVVDVSSIVYLSEHFPRLATLLEANFIEYWPKIRSLFLQPSSVEFPFFLYFQRLALKQFESSNIAFAHQVAALDILLSRDKSKPGNYFELNPTRQELVCAKSVELIEAAWDNRDTPFFGSWDWSLTASGITFDSPMPGTTPEKKLSVTKLLITIHYFLERFRPDAETRARILSALVILEEKSRSEASTTIVELPNDLSVKLSECQFSPFDFRLAEKFKLRNPASREESVVYPLPQTISAERKAKIDEWCFAYNVHRLVAYLLWGSKPPQNLSPTEIGEKLAEFRSLDLDHDWLLSNQELPDGLKEFKTKTIDKVDISMFGTFVATEKSRRLTANAIRFRQLDRDKDGRLSREEAPEVEDFDRLDSNSDRFLDTDEYGLRPIPIKQATVQSTGTVASTTDNDMRAWAEKKLKISDKDGNGFLSPNEFSGDFNNVDLNNDGKIDLDEYMASRK